MPLVPSIPNLFSILEVVLRLRDSAHVFNRNVGGGLEFKSTSITVANPDKQLPYAFVVPIDTIGKPINYTEYYQPREAVLGIVICINGEDHKAQADGKNPVATVHAFSPIIEAIDDCLLRWTPIGFLLDGTPMFNRVHPLGATENRAWVMMEYTIPFRFYHDAYGGGGLNALKPQADIRADKMQQLFVHYKAQGEFPTVVGDRYFDYVPLPIVPPSPEAIAAFKVGSAEFDINDAVRTAIGERHLDVLSEVPQIHVAAFPPS